MKALTFLQSIRLIKVQTLFKEIITFFAQNGYTKRLIQAELRTLVLRIFNINQITLLEVSQKSYDEIILIMITKFTQTSNILTALKNIYAKLYIEKALLFDESRQAIAHRRKQSQVASDKLKKQKVKKNKKEKKDKRQKKEHKKANNLDSKKADIQNSLNTFSNNTVQSIFTNKCSPQIFSIPSIQNIFSSSKGKLITNPNQPPFNNIFKVKRPLQQSNLLNSGIIISFNPNSSFNEMGGQHSSLQEDQKIGQEYDKKTQKQELIQNLRQIQMFKQMIEKQLIVEMLGNNQKEDYDQFEEGQVCYSDFQRHMMQGYSQLR